MISSHVKISYLITLLFCPFNYTKICWCMIETSSDLFRSSSVIFGNLRKIFGHLGKMSGNVRLAFGKILENLRKSSESHRKSSENRQKRRHQHVYIIKRTLHVSSKIWILCSRGKNYISLVRCAHSWDIDMPLEDKIFIFSPPCNILYILTSEDIDDFTDITQRTSEILFLPRKHLKFISSTYLYVVFSLHDIYKSIE